MYLRFGWVVGNVGLLGTLAIVTLGTSITFLTALSIASIATNAPVKAGGAYFLISRSLGLEMGGAIGIPLFLAQAFSVALYIMGFSESMVAIFPVLDIKLVGIITTIFLSLLALFSTKAAIRAQYVILAVIAFSLISFFLGGPIENSHIELWGVPADQSEGFWTVFAVFFPAVTGIMAGVNMSGDLKDPAKSIPKGTFMAVGVGYVIYMIVPFFFAYRADAATLVSDNMIMQKIAYWGIAIVLGIWGATLSSAVGSLLGAPRVLQALVVDKVLPSKLSFLAKGSGPEKIPRAATIFTSVIALILIIVGDLNMIAPILTMFFLTTYGTLNLTSGIETMLRSPSFRPKFRVHWIFSFLGTLGCVAVMFLINALATVVAMVFIIGVYVWMRRRRLKTTFGDVTSGVLLQVIRYALLRLDAKSNDAKSWRPNILVFSGIPTKRWHLIDFAYGIAQEKGLITVATILPEKGVTQERVTKHAHNIASYLREKNIKTLIRVTRAEDPFVGSKQLVNSYGLGSLVPNTVLLGDTEENSHHSAYCEMISHFYQSKRNVIILQNDFKLDYIGTKQIDLWWGGLKGNGGLMMIIAHLIKTSPRWRRISVCVKMVVATEEAAKGTRENLKSILHEMRVDFNSEIIVSAGRPFWDILQQESQDSTMVMMGLKTPDDDFANYYKQLKVNTQAIKNKVFFLASEHIEFEDVLN
jgi:amino acid transporter